MSTPQTPHKSAGDAVNQDTRNETVTSHHFAENAGKRDTFQPCALEYRTYAANTAATTVDKFSNPTN